MTNNCSILRRTPHGQRSLLGYSPWGHRRSGHDFMTKFSLSQLLGTPWTVACQAPLSMVILQARILEWVAMPSSRGSAQPRDRIQFSGIAGGLFTIWATRETQEYWRGSLSLLQGIFLTRDQIGISCIGRQILYQLGATREAPWLKNNKTYNWFNLQYNWTNTTM